MKTLEAVVVNNRFGLGASADSSAFPTLRTREDLRRQLNAAPATPARLKFYDSSAQILSAFYDSRSMGSRDEKRAQRKRARQKMAQEVADRLVAGIETNTPFIERLVMFWSNHFTVSTAKSSIAPAIGAYEREAIRPNVLGRFEDMLIAVCQHVVMLVYLDNHASIGPNSKAGQRRNRDLNENFAREILELHTLGVNGGYAQADVIELALALTGWTHGARVGKKARKRGVKSNPAFVFRAAQHEPGERVVMGKRYARGDQSQGMAILRDLARHPATARFVTTKLLTHFIQDTPTQTDIDQLSQVYLQTNGDLRAVCNAMIDLESAWDKQAHKIKTPYELVVSTYRAVGQIPRRSRRTINALRELGHMPFAAPSPAGWPDTARHWMSPEALIRRIEWARAVSATFDATLDPSQVMRAVLGPQASPQTALWVSRAPSTQTALAMVFASHEFQRR